MRWNKLGQVPFCLIDWNKLVIKCWRIFRWNHWSQVKAIFWCCSKFLENKQYFLYIQRLFRLYEIAATLFLTYGITKNLGYLLVSTIKDSSGVCFDPRLAVEGSCLFIQFRCIIVILLWWKITFDINKKCNNKTMHTVRMSHNFDIRDVRINRTNLRQIKDISATTSLPQFLMPLHFRNFQQKAKISVGTWPLYLSPPTKKLVF